MNWTAIKGTFACIAMIAVSFLAITTARVEMNIEKHVDEVTMRAGDAVDQVNITLKRINGPGGLLQVTGKTVAKADNLIGHTDIMVANEQKSIALFDAQVSSTLQHVDLVLDATALNENDLTKQTVGTLQAASDSMSAVKPLITQLTGEVQDLNTATVGITAMLPDIKATAVNVRGMSDDGHATTTMTRDWLHGILHPTWATRIKDGMLDVLQHLPIP